MMSSFVFALLRLTTTRSHTIFFRILLPSFIQPDADPFQPQIETMTDNTIDKLAAGLKDQLKVDAAPFVPASASATNNNSDGKKSNNNNNKAPQKRNNRGPRNKKPKETKAKQDNETGGSDAPVDAAVVKESNAKNKGKKWKNKDTAGKSKSSPPNNEKQSTTTTGPNKSEKKSKPRNNNQDKHQSDGPENKSEKKNKPNTDNKGQPQGKDKSTANKGKSKAQKKKQNNPPRVDNGDEKQIVEDATSKQSQKQQDKTKKAAKPNKKSSSTSLSSSASTNKQSTIPPNQPQTTNDLNYGAGRPIKVVHIAEKPSIGQAIAVGLGGGGNSKSFGKSLPVHEFTDNSPFPKAPKASKVTHVVSSVAGHVFNVDFPTEFQSWDTVDPAELFHAPVVKKPCKGSVVKHLQEITKGADFLVLWMDCDR
jgi:hypothetical protein